MQKSATRFAPSDWHVANRIQSTTAIKQRDVAHDFRQSSHRLRNDTDCHTTWTQHSSNKKLEKRFSDIEKWKESLEKCLTAVETEIECLSEHKERSERALDAKSVPTEVVWDCMTMREGRMAIDLVRDEVEAQLHKELEVVEAIKSMLLQKVMEAYEQLCVLQEARQQLQLDLTDKQTAFDIDNDCKGMTNESGNISFHANSTRIEKGVVTPDTWDSFSNYNSIRANAEMKGSTALREAINYTVQQTSSDLDTQRLATDRAFRKRIHEIKQAISELEWQRHNTQEEISDVQTEIERLQKSIQNKEPPMMVAQTRLENRTFRPNVELCRDEAQYGLVEEVSEIAGSTQSLLEKLAVAEHTLSTLQRTLARIENDLGVKTSSRDIDNQCMEIRAKLTQNGMHGRHLGREK